MGSPTDWKLTGSQRLTYRSENSEPHIKLAPVGIWHWEKEPLEHLAVKASGACVRELHRTGGNGDPILFCFFLSFVVVVVAISWAAPSAYGGSQARGPI